MARIWTTALLLVVTTVGCSNSKQASLADVDTVEPNRIIACTDMPYAPFEFEDSGEVRGIDIDLLRAIGEDLDAEVSFRDVDFSNIFTELTTNACDVVASAVSITEERQAEYLFSDGYFEVNQSLLVRSSDTETYSNLDALKGRKVGVQSGTTGADYVATRLAAEDVMAFDDASEMIKALEANELDGVVQDFPINSFNAQMNNAVTVVATLTDQDREEYGFAMNKDATDLQEAINTALANVRQDGRYDEILSGYLGTATTK